MAEVYCNAFLRDLTDPYVAGSGQLKVNSPAPAAVQVGTFRVRLGNSANTILIVSAGASTSTWTVTAEANDDNCPAGSNMVLGPEVSAGFIDAIFQGKMKPFDLSFTRPVAANFTFNNAGLAGSSFDSSRGDSIAVVCGAGNNSTEREVNASIPLISTPHTVVMGLSLTGLTSGAWNGGFGLFRTSDWKHYVLRMHQNGNAYWTLYNTLSSVSSNTWTWAWNQLWGAVDPSCVFFKYTNDGATRKLYGSSNMVDWMLMVSEAYNNQFVADAVGFIMNGYPSTAGSVCRMFHFTQSSGIL